MIKAHRIRLHPTEEQQVYFAKPASVARFTWNRALAQWNQQYEAGEKPTALKLKKQFNPIRREQFSWTWEVSKNACDQPFLDLDNVVMERFFRTRHSRMYIASTVHYPETGSFMHILFKNVLALLLFR